MRWSIKRQMTVVFVGLLAFMLILMFIINSRFLGQFYVSHKETDLIDAYNMLSSVLNDGFDLSEDNNDIWNEMEQTNTSLQIRMTSEGEIKVITIRGMETQLTLQLNGYLLNQNQQRGELVERSDSYEIRKIKDVMSRTEYLEMWGYLSDNTTFIMRSPLESIRESTDLANKFLIYIGLSVMVLGGILFWFFSRKLTEPIEQLTELSQRMAELDFDVKYVGNEDDEIGVLGKNFNKMSFELEKTVSELKRANHKLLEDIEQKEKMEDMRNEFLGNVSHELKTPLALIQGYAEGLKEGVNDDPESREFYCDVIMDEASKMNQMVRNLLALNQLEFGSEELEITRFDVAGLIQGVVQSCDILIQQAEAQAEFINSGPVYVWADEFKTEQVIRNYLTNAIHHAENEKRIEIRMIRQETNVRITVFNSGRPIPEEDLKKLWDKFYKVDKAHTREYGGNGIGLSIVKAIMESFHQKYGVKNYENGVEFWFELDCGSAVPSEVQE